MSTEIILKEAMRQYGNGDLDESERLFREILENTPQNGDALYFLGVIAMTRGVYAEALDFLYKATVLYPDNKDYTYSLGVALQETGHTEEAIRTYEKIADLPESQNNLGNLYRTLGELEKAETAFDKALQLDPQMTWAMLNKALLKRAQNQTETARFLLEHAVQTNPHFVEGWYQLGVQYRVEKNIEKSLEAFEHALKLNNAYPPLWTSYGMSLYAQGRLKEAVDAYDHAIALDRFAYDAYFNKGLALEHLNRLQEAEEAYRSAVRGDRHFIQAYNNLGSLLYKMGRLNEALETYRQVFLIDPHNPEANFNLAVILEDIEEFEEAAGLYFHVLSMKKYEEAIHLRLAALLPKWSLTEKEKALTYAEGWVKNFHDNPLARHTLNALKGIIDEDALFSYTQTYYNAFAESYNEKMKELDCQVPQAIAERLPKQRFNRALDLGCGTGALGPFLSKHSETLIGVDMAQKMAQLAEKKGCYQKIIVSDVLDYLSRNKQPFDLIVAADVLCYMSDLTPLFSAVHQNLTPKGSFIFTVEKSNRKEGFEINPFGRFLHTEAYLRHVLKNAGLDIQTIEEIDLRKEGSGTARGLIVTAALSVP